MVWGPRSTYRTPDSRRKILKNLSKNFEKLLGNDLPGHLQSSEFAYAEVQGWQTFPQWSRGPIILIFHSFLDPKIYKKFGAPPVEGTFILIPIDPFKSDQSAGAPQGFEFMLPHITPRKNSDHPPLAANIQRGVFVCRGKK